MERIATEVIFITHKDSVRAAQRKNGFPMEGPISAYCIGK
jgi:hypothetical protein